MAESNKCEVANSWVLARELAFNVRKDLVNQRAITSMRLERMQAQSPKAV